MNALPGEHIVKSFDTELQRLTGEIVRMGEIAAAQVEDAIDALVRQDAIAAGRVVREDRRIDELERIVSHDVLHLLVMRAPVARDLREVLAALRIAADIERIGDHAANIARRSVVLREGMPDPAAGLPMLVDLACEIVREVIGAYADRDVGRAIAARARDAELDALYISLFRSLLTYMMEDPHWITPCTHLLFIAKNIERIGDHATNIAENVWFLVHGDTPMPAREKVELPMYDD
ncbi:MAG: phosphate signaling complex protein PhoU [Proteobacteria bacterium]|nr:phosphate signaling complex protein PhoU [Pseudomonadota bacterium]